MSAALCFQLELGESALREHDSCLGISLSGDAALSLQLKPGWELVVLLDSRLGIFIHEVSADN